MTLRCDLCHTTEVKWDYDCADFELPLLDGQTFVSTGGWIACEECSDIIEQNGIPVFHEPVAQRLAENHGGSAERWKQSVSRLQAAFLEHRSGPRKLLSSEELNAA